MNLHDYHEIIRRQEQEAEKSKRDREWADAFTCPDHTGEAAPCTRQHRDDNVLRVETWEAGRWQRCPIAAKVQCVPWTRILAREAQEREAEKRYAYRQRQIERGIPRRFLAASLDDEPTPALEAVQAFLGGDALEGHALVLLGDVGVGKSWAVAAAVSTWRRTARFLEADAIAQAAARDHDRLHHLTREAHAVSLLALDDLFRGHVKAGGLAESVIEEILCARHADEKATIVTSNVTADQLAARLSARVVDRFREWATLVELPAGSLRGGEA